MHHSCSSPGSDYRPDPKSRTAREIAWQIVNEEKLIIEALETAAVNWGAGGASRDSEGSVGDGVELSL